MSFYLHRVLVDALPTWLALGWREVARSGIPSLFADQVVIRWDGNNQPPRPNQ